MDRRTYLTAIGGISSLHLLDRSHIGLPTAQSLSHTITKTNAPVEGGDELEVSIRIENQSTSPETTTLELYIDEQPSMSESAQLDPETSEMITLRHRLYPVRSDVERTVRVSSESESTLQTIDVLGVSELEDAAVNPAVDVAVQPETLVMFEVDDSVAEDYGRTHWFLDGEYEHQSTEPVYPRDEPPDGYEYWLYQFPSDGVYDIAAAVDNDEQNTTYQWTASVDADGLAPPTIEDNRPTAISADPDREYDVELDVSSPDDELDRIVWWQEGNQYIDAVTDISGNEDTIARTISGGAVPIVWAITAHNLVTQAKPWEVEETSPAEEESPVAANDDLSGLQAYWAELIQQSHGIEVLDITVSDADWWWFYYHTTGVNDAEAYELGAVADGYAWLIDEHPDEAPEILFVSAIENPDVEPLTDAAVGRFYVEHEWGEAWLRGALTEEEYAARVILTYESNPT